jgi:hypothetical protein
MDDEYYCGMSLTGLRSILESKVRLDIKVRAVEAQLRLIKLSARDHRPEFSTRGKTIEDIEEYCARLQNWYTNQQKLSLTNCAELETLLADFEVQVVDAILPSDIPVRDRKLLCRYAWHGLDSRDYSGFMTRLKKLLLRY